MSDERGPGDEGLPSGERLLAMYEAGRLWNELNWLVDQAVMLGHGGPISRVERLLGELAFKLVLALPLNVGSEVKDRLLARRQDWLGLVGSEWFAEELCEARNVVEFGGDTPPSDAFSGLLLQAKIFRDEAAAAFEAQLGDHEGLQAAFLLGGSLDQGLRPPGVPEHLYRMVPNMQRWAHKRSQVYLQEVTQYRRAWAQFHQGRIRPIQISPQYFRDRPQPPWLPAATTLAGVTCLPGTVTPPTWWPDAVEAYWRRAALPVDSLIEIASKTRSSTEMVFRLDRAVRKLYRDRYELKPISSTLCQVQPSDLQRPEEGRNRSRGGLCPRDG